MNSETLSTIRNRGKKTITENGETEKGVDAKNEELEIKVEPKTGVPFPVKLNNAKELKAVGLRKKIVFGLSIKIYSFGMYADKEKLMQVFKSKLGNGPVIKATQEMHRMVIDCAEGITVKMVIVFSNLTMTMVRKNFNEGLGTAIKKLGGGKNEDLTKRIMGEATDEIKLTPGSEIEITCLPGYVLESKVRGKVVSKFESEILCKAFIYMYLGDEPLDKEAKEQFGISLVSDFNYCC